MNEHMKDFIKIVKSLGASDFIIKVVNQIMKNKTKKTKDSRSGFLGLLLGTLSTSSLGKKLADKAVKATSWKEQGVIRLGKGTIRAGQEF